MAIHWQVQFKSLKSATVYTASIYDPNYSGNTRIQLKGGAQPFVTQEDDTDDMFTPIRTQSGYLRIVDDGYDADGNAFNWRTFIPTTDTDRPVILSHEENGSTVIDWMGFMQAQNFGAQLYGNPQEREFPLQCPLTILSCTDIRIDSDASKQIHNFAYLLNLILSAIGSPCSPSELIIQGNTDAQQWLLKRIDWQNFVSEDAEGNAEPRYDMFQCLEEMCRFGGWTARIYGETLYLLCIDDLSEQKFLKLTTTQLATLAGGNVAGTTNVIFASTTIGNIFASTDNTDTQMRGPNKVSVSANSDGNTRIMGYAPLSLVKQMRDLLIGGQMYSETYEFSSSHYLAATFSNNLNSFNSPYEDGQVLQGGMAPYNSFNLMQTLESNGSYYGKNWSGYSAVIRIRKTYNGGAMFKMSSHYEHTYSGGYLVVKGKTIQEGRELVDTINDWPVGKYSTFAELGIGPSENDASTMWFNGHEWTTTREKFEIMLGNEGDVMYVKNKFVAGEAYYRDGIPIKHNMHGKMFLYLYGSNNIPEISITLNAGTNNETTNQYRAFELSEFAIEYDSMYEYEQSAIEQVGYILDIGKKEYKASNNANVHTEENIEAPFVSSNDMHFGTNILANPNDTFMGKIDYNGPTVTNEYPEQHLANRIASYWSKSRRKIECYVLAHDGTAATNANSITPRYRVSIDGTVMAPISISRNWRDYIISLSLMELFPDD